jgi:hypothetical protein
MRRDPRKRFQLRFLLALACACTVLTASGNPGREFLTDKEIELIQAHHEIDMRVKLYLDFAASRLRTAEERLSGKESEPGDPFEFLAPEDMLGGYYRIFESIMMNLEDAHQKSDPLERSKVQRALKALKGATESDLKQLEILKKIAEEKDKEELWDLVNKAIDISSGAHKGAESGISKEPDPSEKKAGNK